MQQKIFYINTTRYTWWSRLWKLSKFDVNIDHIDANSKTHFFFFIFALMLIQNVHIFLVDCLQSSQSIKKCQNFLKVVAHVITIDHCN